MTRTTKGFARVFPRRGKYNNRKTVAAGHTFDSKKEAARYLELRALESAGMIRNLTLQVPFKLEVNGVKVCTYRADFCFEERQGRKWVAVTEDVKGILTPTYRLKKKLMKAVLGIEIREV